MTCCCFFELCTLKVGDGSLVASQRPLGGNTGAWYFGGGVPISMICMTCTIQNLNVCCKNAPSAFVVVSCCCQKQGTQQLHTLQKACALTIAVVASASYSYVSCNRENKKLYFTGFHSSQGSSQCAHFKAVRCLGNTGEWVTLGLFMTPHKHGNSCGTHGSNCCHSLICKKCQPRIETSQPSARLL